MMTRTTPPKLGAFSWTEFFSQRGGGDVVEALRNAWKKDYEYVLIDSRTGLTDSSGVCTIQMPDLIVMLFAANEQNVDWCLRIARGIRNGRSNLPYDRTFLPIIPLLSRFDAREESDRAGEAMDRIAEQFAPFFADWLPRSITARDMLAWSVLPYVPRYSFEEGLAVEDEPATGAQGLSFYYQLLSRLSTVDLRVSVPSSPAWACREQLYRHCFPVLRNSIRNCAEISMQWIGIPLPSKTVLKKSRWTRRERSKLLLQRAHPFLVSEMPKHC